MTEPSSTETSSTEAAEAPVRAQLAACGISHEIMACDPDLADTAQFCDAYGIDPADSANTIVVIGKPRSADAAPSFAACVVLATCRLDVNNAVRKRLGVRKASFASAEQTRDLTNMLIGGVTVFGLPENMPIWVDAAVMTRARIVVGGGSRSSKVLLAPGELAKLAAVEVVEGLANPID